MNYDIEKLVKHRRKMLLLDRLVSCSEDEAVGELTITSESTFLNNDHVPAWVGVEYAAQTVAAMAGARSIRNGQETKVGLLLSCRRYKCARPQFMLGETLTIHVTEEFNDGRMGAYFCTISVANENIASVSLSAYVPEDVGDINDVIA